MSVIQETLQRLVAERNRAWNEAKEIIETANKRDQPGMTGEEREKFDRIDTALNDLDKEITGWQDRDRREIEAAQARSEYEQVVRPEVIDKRDGDMNAQVLAFLRGGPDAPRVLELDVAAVAQEKRAIRSGASGKEFRDLAVVTNAGGGYTVPTTLVRSLYDFLEVYSGVRSTRVTVITTTSGEPIDYPTVASHGTAAIVGEGSALAENDPTFGKVTLTPYKYGQLIQITTELLTDSGFDITGFVAEDAARAIVRVTDPAYINGSGSNQPQGFGPLVGTAVTIQTVATGVPSYANLVNGAYSVNNLYRQNAEWLMRDATAGTLRLMVDTTNRPLWEPGLQVGTPDRFLGFNVRYDPNVGAIGTAASTPIYFGDFSAYVIRDISSVRFERSDEFAFSSDLVTFRSLFRTTGNLVDRVGGAIKKFMEPTT
jgi:HK97 family phage major capsid protein